MYRLLDAEVTFHGPLPQPGQVIEYDIRIQRFFKHGETHLFRFEFDAAVEGSPLMTMRQGCAGFFTPQELDAGRGLVQVPGEEPGPGGVAPGDKVVFAAIGGVESYGPEGLAAMRSGDLTGCFGPDFSGLGLNDPLTLPSGRLELIHRVTRLDPNGGRYGLGEITAEADIRPDDWFLTCHFVDDRVMPGTLMYECCLHTLRFFLLRLGWVGEKNITVSEPVSGITSKLKCRGQVIETTGTAAYQVHVKQLGFRPAPFAVADAVMYADGKPIVEITDMCLQLSGLDKSKLEALWAEVPKSASPSAEPLVYEREHLLAFAVGRPSEAFGPAYRVFDRDRFVARLPGPPYQFLDRAWAEEAEPLVMRSGARAVTEYRVPPSAWYLEDNRGDMPLSVLLEIGLQSCGFLAAYMGSALTSDSDLHFRNLGGTAVRLGLVGPDAGLLTTRVRCAKVSSSAGMIIQNYDFETSDARGPVYRGQTYFGFFTKDALAQQVGLQGAEPLELEAAEVDPAEAEAYPQGAPLAGGRMLMLDRVTLWRPHGGPCGLGRIRGTKTIDPEEWFFKAHFFQDPVWPGSLGLEAFIQLLALAAARRWPEKDAGFTATAPELEHSWTYRGQVIPDNREVTVDAVVTQVDDERYTLKADGRLSVDGLAIYEMKDFSIQAI